MKQMTMKNRTTWIISAATMAFCMVLSAFSSYAADRVVVIPMGKSGPPTPLAKTGQTHSYIYGDDGDLQKGTGMTSTRFVDNNNGTVTDNLTGLIWLKDGQCLQFFSGDPIITNDRPWVDAIAAANKLANGYCGLTDGSIAGDWRLPNINELASLIDRSQFNPALPAGCPLTLVSPSPFYWSSSTAVLGSNDAWLIIFNSGIEYYDYKSSGHYVRPVRGGQ